MLEEEASRGKMDENPEEKPNLEDNPENPETDQVLTDKEEEAPALEAEQEKTEAQEEGEELVDKEAQEEENQFQALEEELRSVKAALEQKTQEAQEWFRRLQRLQADFDNYRRRSRKELQDMAEYASEKLILRLLPVLDNFERAIASAPEDQLAASYVDGVNMIYRQLVEVLQQEGVASIEAVGQPFDPEKHEAVMQIETSEYEDNTVVEELRKGYTLKGKILRPAMVKVAKKPLNS
ncbi:nucleotide exchange factor GrpE [Calderihabitans maritimus]|uniref:Protein GrpE n=1 Tax=Calderihabitans maritimus TaxID=1246530 RepID=A0A1Z5HVA9_9FIRM|nr:nucleotide exchange factor GrpE [Calderihabitans maritimus]GAW93452.1 molecular chaperone GrpE [Calderihabitans maritimus]